MAIQFGAAHEILPLNQIASALLNKLAASPSSVRHRI
jgi:two-component system chemotaxis response regulator CheB